LKLVQLFHEQSTYKGQTDLILQTLAPSKPTHSSTAS